MIPLATRLDAALLEEAWRRARRSPGPGVDGVHGGRFARGLEGRLDELRRDLIDGRYQPSPLLRRVRPKPDGGERVLGIPTLRDRVAQGAVLLAAAELDGRLLPSVHGYRPGRSPSTAVRQLVERAGTQLYMETVQADIHGMFDHLEHGRLHAALASAWGDPLWLALNQTWMAAWPTAPGRGVPQGAPLSPMIANLYLGLHLDPHLERAASGAALPHAAASTPAARLAAARRTLHRALVGHEAPRTPTFGPELVAWIRYGDDLVLVSGARGGGLKLLQRLDALVRAAGLTLGDRKTTTWASRAGMPLPRPVLGVHLTFQRGPRGWSLALAGPLPQVPEGRLPWENER